MTDPWFILIYVVALWLGLCVSVYMGVATYRGIDSLMRSRVPNDYGLDPEDDVCHVCGEDCGRPVNDY